MVILRARCCDAQSSSAQEPAFEQHRLLRPRRAHTIVLPVTKTRKDLGVTYRPRMEITSVEVQANHCSVDNIKEKHKVSSLSTVPGYIHFPTQQQQQETSVHLLPAWQFASFFETPRLLGGSVSLLAKHLSSPVPNAPSAHAIGPPSPSPLQSASSLLPSSPDSNKEYQGCWKLPSQMSETQ